MPKLNEMLRPMRLDCPDVVTTSSEGFPREIDKELKEKLARSAEMLIDLRSRPSN